jgi:hypothetical protein
MKSTQFILIIPIIAAVCFFGGYKISVNTGVEPGYLGAVEAAGYGGDGGEKIEGVTEEMSDYYKSLQEE